MQVEYEHLNSNSSAYLSYKDRVRKSREASAAKLAATAESSETMSNTARFWRECQETLCPAGNILMKPPNRIRESVKPSTQSPQRGTDSPQDGMPGTFKASNKHRKIHAESTVSVSTSALRPIATDTDLVEQRVSSPERETVIDQEHTEEIKRLQESLDDKEARLTAVEKLLSVRNSEYKTLQTEHTNLSRQLSSAQDPIEGQPRVLTAARKVIPERSRMDEPIQKDRSDVGIIMTGAQGLTEVTQPGSKQDALQASPLRSSRSAKDLHFPKCASAYKSPYSATALKTPSEPHHRSGTSDFEFVNYTLNDVGELSTRVDPSGSYKMMARRETEANEKLQLAMQGVIEKPSDVG